MLNFFLGFFFLVELRLDYDTSKDSLKQISIILLI